MVGVGVAGLGKSLFFWLGKGKGVLRSIKNLIFRLEIEARRREPHLERNNRSGVEDDRRHGYPKTCSHATRSKEKMTAGGGESSTLFGVGDHFGRGKMTVGVL